MCSGFHPFAPAGAAQHSKQPALPHAAVAPKRHLPSLPRKPLLLDSTGKALSLTQGRPAPSFMLRALIMHHLDA